MICEEAEHTHGDDCYDENHELTCMQTEHTHGDGCYAVPEAQAEAGPQTYEVADQEGLNAALAQAQSGDTILLTGDITLGDNGASRNTAAVELPEGVTLDGGDHVLYAKEFASEAHTVGVRTAGVVIRNLVIDNQANVETDAENDTYSGGSAKHCLNVYGSGASVLLDNVTLRNSRTAGLVITGGSVEVSSLSTQDNAWGGVNVDKGGSFVLLSGENNYLSLGEAAGLWTEGNDSTITLPEGSYYEKVTGMGENLKGYTYYTTSPALLGQAMVISESGKTIYEAFGDAFEALQSGETLQLLQNVDLTASGLLVDKSFTLDLNGCTVQAGNRADNNIQIAQGAHLTVLDERNANQGGEGMGSVGKIFSTMSYNDGGRCGLVEVRGELTLSSGDIVAVSTTGTAVDDGLFGVTVLGSGKVTVDGGSIQAGWYAISGNGTETGATSITINGGTLTSLADYAIYQPQNGSLILNAGTVEGYAGGIAMNRGDLEITGGRVACTGDNATTGDWSDGTGGMVNAALNLSAEYGAVTASISGGYIDGGSASAIVAAESGAAVSITGGNFSGANLADIGKFCDEDHTCNEDGLIVVKPDHAAAKSGEFYYLTLQEAVDNGSGEVELLKNAEENLIIPENQVVTLNMGTFTLTSTAPVIVEQGATLTVNGGTITSAGSAAVRVKSNATVNLNGCEAAGTYYSVMAATDVTSSEPGGPVYATNATININGGTYKGIYTNGSSSGHTVTIKDGRFTDTTYFAAGDSTYTIEGGSFDAGSHNAAIELDAGTLNISGGTFTANIATENSSETPTNTNGSGGFTGVIVACKPTTSSATGYRGDAVVNITGGTFTNTLGDAIVVADFGAQETSGKAALSISGTAEVTGKVALYRPEGKNEDAKIAISGGSFSTDVSEFCAPMWTTKLVNGRYEIVVEMEEVGATVTSGENVQYFQNLGQAIKAAGDGDVVTMFKDYDKQLTVGVYPASARPGMAITLDLNGHKIEKQGAAGKNWAYGIFLQGADKLTIRDSSAEKTGMVSAIPAEGKYSAGITIWDDAELVVEGGTIQGSHYGIAGNGSKVDGTNAASRLTITGGSVIATAANGTGIYHPDPSRVVLGDEDNPDSKPLIQGGATGIEIRAGELEIYNAKIVGAAARDEFTAAPSGSGTTVLGAGLAIVQHTTKNAITVTIYDAEISGIKAIYEANLQNNPAEDVAKLQLAVLDGTFTGSIESENIADFISGGTFDSDITKYCIPGFMGKWEDGKYSVVEIGNGSMVLSGRTEQAVLSAENDLSVSTITLSEAPLSPENGGWSVSASITVPNSITAESLGNVTYFVGSDTETLFHLESSALAVTVPVSPELLAACKANGENLVYSWTFDWNGDGRADQVFRLVVDPDTVQLTSPAGGLAWPVARNTMTNQSFGSLSAAIEATGSTPADIRLLGDVAESIVLGAGQNITLDLGGHTITNTLGRDTITVGLGGILTLTGNGTVDNVSNSRAALFNNGSVTLASGTFTRSAENSGDNTWYVLLNHGTMTIQRDVTVTSGSTYSSLIENGYQNYHRTSDPRQGHNAAVNAPQPSLTIVGGTFSGGLNTVKNDDGGILTINDGTFRNTAQAAVLNWNWAVITGGDFEVTTSHAAVIVGLDEENTTTINGDLVSLNQGYLEVNGGRFAAPAGIPAIAPFRGEEENLAGLWVSGGSFSSDENVKNYCVENATTTWDEATGMYIIAAPIAVADGEYYASLQEAMDAANGNTVFLLRDITLSEPVTIKNVSRFDLNGHTLATSSADNYLNVVSDSPNSELLIRNGHIISAAGDALWIGVDAAAGNDIVPYYGTVRTESLTLTSLSTDSGYTAVFVDDGGHFILSADSSISSSAIGILTIGASQVEIYGQITTSNAEDASVVGDSAPENWGTVITIYDGASVRSSRSQAIYHPQLGLLKVEGGEISGAAAGIRMEGGTLEITGGTVEGNVALHEVSAEATPVSMSVSGGSFQGSTAAVLAEKAQHFIIGGTFSTAPAVDCCASGYFPVQLSSGEWTVEPLYLRDVTPSATVMVGSAFALSASSNAPITWSSDDESIATVDEQGRITGVRAGATTIQVLAGSGSSTVTASVAVTIIPRPAPVVPDTPDDRPDSGEDEELDEDDTPLAGIDPSATVTAKESGASASASVGNAIVDTLADEAVARGSENVTVTVDGIGNVDRVVITIPSSAAAKLGEKTKASLTLETALADLVLANASLRQLGGSSGNITVTITKLSTSNVDVRVSKNGQALATVAGGLQVRVPASGAGLSTVAMLVGADGKETLLRKAVAIDGTMTVTLPGSSQIKLVNNAKTFGDVSNHWASNAIAFVSSRELFQGIAQDTFGADIPMNRAMLVTVLHRLEDLPTAGTIAFPDVPDGRYFTDAVAWATSESIVTGTDAGEFAPYLNVTREQLAVFLYRYASYLGVSTTQRSSLSAFADAGSTSAWARDAMSWAVGAGLISGKAADILDPTAFTTRGEVATVLMRFCQNTAAQLG